MAFGITSGVTVYVLATAAGLGALLAAAPTAVTAIRLAGAASLACLAWSTRGAAGPAPGHDPDDDVGDGQHVFRRGFLVNLANPKIDLSFTAFLPQFLGDVTGNPAAQLLMLGLVLQLLTVTSGRHGGVPCGLAPDALVVSRRPRTMARMVDDAPRTLPSDPAALAGALPDVPQWVYARSLLLAGDASVRLNAAGDAALVLEPSTAVLVGQPDPELLRTALTPDPPGLTLLAREDALSGLHAALPGWTPQRFVVHTLQAPVPGDTSPTPGVVVSAPLDPGVLAGLPEDVRADAVGAPAAAVRVLAGEPVAVCFVADLTETLWDVGVDTVEQARRQGHATAAFRALAAVMAARGRQPVWAAYEDYPPSLALAARLGFRPVARMVELSPPPEPPSGVP